MGECDLYHSNVDSGPRQVFGAIATTGSRRAVACAATAYKVMLILLASACFTAIDVVAVRTVPRAGRAPPARAKYFTRDPRSVLLQVRA